MLPLPTVRLPDANGAWFGANFFAGQFVGRKNRQHFVHAFGTFQRRDAGVAFLAHDGHYRAFGTLDGHRLEPQIGDVLDNVCDFVTGCILFHHDNHVLVSPFVTRWFEKRDCARHGRLKKPRGPRAVLGVVALQLSMKNAYANPPAPLLAKKEVASGAKPILPEARNVYVHHISALSDLNSSDLPKH